MIENPDVNPIQGQFRTYDDVRRELEAHQRSARAAAVAAGSRKPIFRSEYVFFTGNGDKPMLGPVCNVPPGKGDDKVSHPRYRPRSDARYEGSRRPFVSIPPSVLELRLVNQSINQSLSCQSQHMLAILARQVPRIRANSLSPTRHPHRAWFSPLSMRCLRPCTPPVRLFSVYSLRVQPSIRHKDVTVDMAEYTHHPPPGLDAMSFLGFFEPSINARYNPNQATDFYQLLYDNELPPFDEANAYSIYTRTIERYTTLVMARAYKIRAIIHTLAKGVAPRTPRGS
eukprot:scaffold32037_cov114-Isochrysis_galbana.AAC.1